MQPASSSNQPPSKHPRPDKPGPWPPRIEPFVPRTDHNPTELKTWAKRTGFNSNSGELSRQLPSPLSRTAPTNAFHDQPTSSAAPPTHKQEERAGKGPTRVTFNPVRLGRRLRERWEESTGVNKSAGFSEMSEDLENQAPLPDRAVHPHPNRVEIEPALGGERRNGAQERENGSHVTGSKKESDGVDLLDKRSEREFDSGLLSDSQWEVEGDELREKEVNRPGGLKCGVTENPGWGMLALLFLVNYAYFLLGMIGFRSM